MSVENLFNIKVNVERPAEAIDDYGINAKTFATQITDMPARLQRRKASEVIYADRDTVLSDYVLYCGTENSIEANDRILYDSEYYQIVGIDADNNQIGVYQKLDLLKVK